MDLLARPSGSKPPIDKAPLFSTHRWDGGSFKGFAHRSKRLKWVPEVLRDDLVTAADPSSALEPPPSFIAPGMRPSDESDDEHGFFQAWFFFGLLAEIFCLNELADGSRLVPADQAARELDGLYQDFVTAEDDDDGHQRCLTGAKLLEPAVGEMLAGRWVGDPGGLEARLGYLAECASLAHWMVVRYRGSSSRLESGTHFSICALGEIVTTTIAGITQGSGFGSGSGSGSYGNGPDHIALPWGAEYVAPGGAVEASMLAKGWCPSDLARVRRVYPRLNTQHYLSCMPGDDNGLDHARCSRHGCVAAQIVPGEYSLSHAEPGCDCATVGVDVEKVIRILETTDTFPVLTVRNLEGGLGEMEIVVEEYDEDRPYVALSHVWAHGLGNPLDNSLHRCQVARVARMTGRLGDGPPLRIWIDTLCCPIDLDAKIIALQRMASVYRQARHVLVLDLAVAATEARAADPALLCLCVLGRSTWMRRLWTLQEGMLPKSVYFQFSDQALRLESIAADLYRKGILDARYLAIYQDVQVDAIRIGIRIELDGPSSEAVQALDAGDTIQRRLWLLQGSLALRSVSVADDEPLCIETLLGLEPRRVAELQGRDARMAHVWTMLARAGAVPPRVIFYVDEPVPLPGFGWAPRSLLNVGPDSHLANLDLAVRFDSLLPFTRGFDPDGNPAHRPATLTPEGLRVTYPGFRVGLRSWRPGGSLDGWMGLSGNEPEHGLICRHAASGQWYHMVSNYRSQVVAAWSAERRKEYDAQKPWPLYNEIRRGNVALIKDAASESMGAATYLMVRALEQPRPRDDAGVPDSKDEALHVETLCSVNLSAYDATNCRFCDTLSELSAETSARLVSLYGDGGGSSQTGGSTSADNVIAVMQELAERRLDEDEAFAQGFRTIMGVLRRENAWRAVAMWLPFNLVLEDVPGNQVWVVDKREA